MKVHNYKINRGSKVFHRLYITGKAVMGYDPNNRKFTFISDGQEMFAEGEQAKLGVLENSEYINLSQS